MSRWITKNLSLILLSVLLAFFFWAVATEAEDPTRDEWYSPAQPVEIRGLPEGMTTYAPDTERVRIKIQAPQTVWETLQASDISAYIDLSDVQTGTIKVPIQVDVGPEPSTITEVRPGEIELTVEHIAEKEVGVNVRVQGTPTLGFTPGEHEVAPQSVRIRGPESRVRQVVEALIVVSVADRQADLRSDLEPVPMDENEQAVALVEMVPKSVTIHVPVTRWLETRDVPVNPSLVGQPASGYRIADLEIDPQILTVYGRADVLDSTSTIQTESVDLEGITRTLQTTVALRLPTGLFVFSAQSTASVTLTVEAIRSGLTLEVTPAIHGLGPNLTATVGLDAVIVILSGPLGSMEALDPASVEAALDLSGYAPGDYSVEPVIELPNEIEIENITPQAVPVKIEVFVQPTAPVDGFR